VSGSHDPRDVLAAVQRLEAGLDEIRARTTSTETGGDFSAGDQRALVEDLEVLVDLVGSSWRTTRDEVAAVAAELAELRQLADEARAALKDVRFELRLVTEPRHDPPY
jgi:predicted  nucleic acid-binding Zn-ribbon protein